MLMGKLRHGEEKQLTQDHMTASKQAPCLLLIYYIGLAKKFLWVSLYSLKPEQSYHPKTSAIPTCWLFPLGAHISHLFIQNALPDEHFLCARDHSWNCGSR